MRFLPLANNPTLVPLYPQLEPLRGPMELYTENFTDATEIGRHSTAEEGTRVNPYNLQLNLNAIISDIEQPKKFIHKTP